MELSVRAAASAAASAATTWSVRSGARLGLLRRLSVDSSSQQPAAPSSPKKSLVDDSPVKIAVVPGPAHTLVAPHLPTFYRAKEFRNRVAVCDKDGCFLYEDVFRRSVDLARGIRDLLPASSAQSAPPRVCFLCPNGVSYVIAQWACWMAGAVAVPLHDSLNEATVEHYVRVANCALVIATQSNVDKVSRVSKSASRSLICLDGTWTANPKETFDQAEALPHLLLQEDFYNNNTEAMLLFTPGHLRSVSLTHSMVNARADSVGVAWALDGRCSALHALPLHSAYGAVDALAAPLAVGGKVVMLSQFDPVKVWSHILGIGISSAQPMPKVNLFPSMPSQYSALVERYRQLFADRRTQDYIRTACVKRLRASISSLGPMDKALAKEWKTITGHTIVDCYNTTELGSVLCGPLVEPSAGVASSSPEEDSDAHSLLPMPGVQAKVVRSAGSSSSGDLLIRRSGQTASSEVEDETGSWVLAGNKASVKNGQFKIISSQ